MNRSCHITTFYSFKGGVGRTMLLANVGVALAQKGRRVLVWDLDVEAPGMHLIPALTPKPLPEAGLLEWLLDWQGQGGTGEPDGKQLAELIRRIRPVPGLEKLHILPAFGDRADWAGIYQKIRWNEFLVQEPAMGLKLFQRLLSHLAQTGGYDHILLDSRTGMTDLGGLMTAVLPHATILVGSFGSQNLSGLLRVYKALQPAVDNRLAVRGDLPPLQRLVVVSPVPEDQEQRRAARRQIWDREFPAGSDEIRVEIPFDSRLLFSEDVLCLTDPEAPAAGRYREVADQLDRLRDALQKTRAAVEKAEAAYPEFADSKDPRGRKKKGQTFEERVARLLTLLDYKVEPEQLIDANRVDLLDHALEWAGGRGRRLWLLLGDYGTGKTCFFKRFAYELAKRHLDAPEDQRPPVPMAIDLKEFPNAITLEGLIQEHLRRYADWHGNPEILLHLLARGRVVLLLDAFDEMGTAAAGRSVEEQFRLLARQAAAEGEPKGNRVLITCCTHFFRDQQYVKDVACLGPDDDLIARDSTLGRVARSFEAAIDELMLFDDDQIRTFLERRLPAAKAEEARRFIQQTYDLPRLAPRPVMLEMIVQALPELMTAGEGLTPAGLYDRYTSQWLETRSGGSLQTTPNQRKRLLEHLAFELWGRDRNRIHHRDLVNVLRDLPPESLAGLDVDRVDLELRTAAFLTRTADGLYGFSHKSFSEFFYAQHLLRALRQGSESLAAALNTAPLTPECVAFLADLIIEEGDREKAAEGIKAILTVDYRPRISENALRLGYLLAKAEKSPSLASILEGPENRMAFFLPGNARLAGANISGEDFFGVRLLGADFSDADLTAAMVQCRRDGERPTLSSSRQPSLPACRNPPLQWRHWLADGHPLWPCETILFTDRITGPVASRRLLT